MSALSIFLSLFISMSDCFSISTVLLLQVYMKTQDETPHLSIRDRDHF